MTNCCDRLIEACENGNVELVKEILNKSIKKLRSKGSKSLLRALSVACEHFNSINHQLVIKILISYDVDAYEELYKACRSSNLELAKFIIKHIGSSEYLYTRCLQEATMGSGSKDPSRSADIDSSSMNIATIKYFLDKTTHHQVSFYAVCKRGNLDAIKLFIDGHQIGHNLIYYGILNTCLGGQLKAFNYLLPKMNKITHDLINNSFTNACLSDNIHLVKYIYNIVPEYATNVPRNVNNIQVIKYLVERGLFVFRGSPLHIFEPIKKNSYYTYLSEVISYKHRLWFLEHYNRDIVSQIRNYVG